eukprot:TRINITY_DN2411_c0_g1_i1.p1 TRINITY_DN2411_c0_g1~~TRINITY_DN2411_c0_g1_i1.p1  ORF type:complete len:1683 (+),score=610.24 TRINITY_DN2411_c0_g1_i1:113-5161(+)
MPHPHHVDNTTTINKLLKALSPEHLKLVKCRFLAAEGRRLDRERLLAAIQGALMQWAQLQVQRDGSEGRRRAAAKGDDEKAQEVIAREFGSEKQLARSVSNLFDQLDSDCDGLVDWLDVSNFIAEATATKQTIRLFNDRPEVREWEGIGSLPGLEVDRLVYIPRWRKVVLCTQHRVVPVFTPPNSQHPSGALWAELVGHKSSVMNAAFIEPIGRLATSSSDSTVIIWDEKQQCVMKQIPFAQPVLCMAAVRLSDRSLLYTGGLDSSPVSATMREGAAGTTTHPSTIRGYDLDGLMKWEAGAVEDRDWSRERREEGREQEEGAEAGGRRGVPLRRPWMWENPRKYPRTDVKFVAGAGAAGSAAGTAAGTGASTYRDQGHSHDDWVTDLVVIPDLRLLVSSSLDKTIRVWGDIDQPKSELRHTKVGHSKGVLSLCYVEEYRTLLSAGCGKELLVWNPFTQNPPLATLSGHEKQVIGVHAFPNSPTAVSMDATGRVIVWDLRTQTEAQNIGGPLSKYVPNPVSCCCLDSFEGQLIAIGRQMSWYRTRETVHVHKIRLAITHVLLHYKRQLVYLASGNKLHVYSCIDGTPTHTVERLGLSLITGLCFSSEELGEIALCTADGKIKTVGEDWQVRVLPVSVPSGVAALHNVTQPPVPADHRPLSRHDQKILLAVSHTGQVVSVNHTKTSHVRTRAFQGYAGGPSAPNLAVRITCFSPAKNVVVLFGGLPEPQTARDVCTMEAWHLSSCGSTAGPPTPIYDPVAKGPLASAVTAACMLDSQSCMLTCDVDGGLLFWNQHNFARMIRVQLSDIGAAVRAQRPSAPDAASPGGTAARRPFTATHVGVNEACLSIVITDERRIRVVSFLWAASRFFEVHKDAAWNLVSVPAERDVFRGRYVIERVLKGGFNVVKLGVDLRLNKRVALKTVTDLTDYTTEVKVCESVAKESSDFIIRMFDHWMDPPPEKGPRLAHIVFECGDATLWEAIRTRSLSPEESHCIVDCMTSGLADMHRTAFVHTDFKPKNVVRFGHLWKVIDLDNAHSVGEPMPLRFTPHYCPPEMAEKKATGRRLSAALSFDVWCYGCVVFEVITGERLYGRTVLFRGECPPAVPDDVEVSAIVSMLTSDDMQERLDRRIAALKGYDDVLHRVVHECLRRDPAERWTMEQCRDYLTAEGRSSVIAAAPMELRPFPQTVPEDVQLLRLDEPEPVVPRRPRSDSQPRQQATATPDTGTEAGNERDTDAATPPSGAGNDAADDGPDEQRTLRYGTLDTRCTSITAFALHEYPHAVVVADFDTYSRTAVLRVYSLGHKYHGRLPTNDYDDTDVNWTFPLQSAEPPPQSAVLLGSPAGGRKPPQSPPQQSRPLASPRGGSPRTEASPCSDDEPPRDVDEGEILVSTPRTLLKTFSWGTLKAKIDDHTARPRREAHPGAVADSISPFFSEWKRSGAQYDPVSAFYQKRRRNSLEAIQLEQRRAARRAARRREQEQHLANVSRRRADMHSPGRDVGFLKASPRPSPLVKPMPGQHGDGGGAVAEEVIRFRTEASRRRDINKLTTVRVQSRGGELHDALLWTQPPKRRFVGADGSPSPWVHEADRLLGTYDAAAARRPPRPALAQGGSPLSPASEGTHPQSGVSFHSAAIGEDDDDDVDVYGGIRVRRSATQRIRASFSKPSPQAGPKPSPQAGPTSPGADP